ncbi:HAMP domain-containing sensor histidine kinase [Microvirga sp. CF3062]|uniref:sensor histidine kinase n=1 Tax=Microvirga sp. CF3062 TaxID=3110182 RepID=UPI002E77B8BA|nr:HAMP domain-containing sensor histidine kinase [Microvirga sp. CF3062]MEE1656928.1 HAMP domain-containing sensor histidine kinase [Microvirga sp. CF3062]
MKNKKVLSQRRVIRMVRQIVSWFKGAHQRQYLNQIRGEDILNVVSHQLLTPLAVINSSAQYMQRRSATIDAAELERRSTRIRQVTDELISSSRALLERFRSHDGHIPLEEQPIALQGLFEAALDHIRLCQPERVVHFSVSSDAEIILADPLLLQAVLIILVDNGVKYSKFDTPIVLSGLRSSNTAIISVSDCGIGIPKDEISRLFSPGFRAQNARGYHGSGIGLHLANRIVRNHRGSITVDSIEGVGTTFNVHLPGAYRETL